jgi:hypothetical protein
MQHGTVMTMQPGKDIYAKICSWGQPGKSNSKEQGDIAAKIVQD